MTELDIGTLSAVMFASFRPRTGRITMPDVCCDLIWVDERLWLAGPQSRALPSSSAGQNVQLLNIDPLVARAWLGMSLHELTDRKIPFDDVDAGRAGPLAEMFYDGRAVGLVRPGARLSNHPIDARAAAAGAALRHGGSVRQAAAAVGISERQLERLFESWFGLSPKQYAKILRFRNAMQRAKKGGSLVDAALTAGYSDQSHFNKDARALAETSPRALLPHVGNLQDVSIRIREY